MVIVALSLWAKKKEISFPVRGIVMMMSTLAAPGAHSWLMLGSARVRLIRAKFFSKNSINFEMYSNVDSCEKKYFWRFMNDVSQIRPPCNTKNEIRSVVAKVNWKTFSGDSNKVAFIFWLQNNFSNFYHYWPWVLKPECQTQVIKQNEIPKKPHCLMNIWD